MDKINKALRKLTERERITVKSILENIKKEKFKNLNIEKLKGHDDIFRVRKGKIRIIFRRTKEIFLILSVERITDKTYKDL